MKLRHQRLKIAVGGDEVCIHVARMTRSVAHALDSGDRNDATQEIRKRRRPAALTRAVISVDVLADQRDFAHAGGGEPLDLVNDAGDGTRRFGAPRVGNDAERAELVAALLHGYESGDAATARCRCRRRRHVIELVVDREFGVDHFGATLRPGEKRRQPVVILRPDHDVDERCAADDLLALGLRHASRHRDDYVAAVERRLSLEKAEAAKLGIDLLGRLLADVTGIEDDEVGVVGGRRRGEIPACQEVGHTIGIVDVHLTAVGFDVDFAQPLEYPDYFIQAAANRRPSYRS